ncbi:MAG: AAA family ATPase, partial [Cyanobacteria bacterium REEB65]|nr:AAA family ATPase [Cyanobacteria bacterium REEB65]
DLGLLEALGSAQAGKIAGTLTYLAPENFTGKPLSASSDLYALGVMAFELLTGAPPFPEKDSADLIAAHLTRPPDPLDEQVSGLPPEFSAMVMRLLAKNPMDRPQRAADVLRALAPWTSSQGREDRQAYSYLLPAGLVGRREEIARLEQAWKSVGSGAGQGVLIGALPGVGKSRLIGELKVRCQLENVPFISSRCTAEGGGAYGAFRQLIRGLLPFAAAKDRDRYASELAILLSTGAQTAAKAAEPVDSIKVQEAIVAFIASVASHTPLVLWIDDLQWADTLSLKVFAYALGIHRRAQVMWVGTYRSDEIDRLHPVTQILEDSQVHSCMLAPFTAEETRELVASMLGTATLPGGLMELVIQTAQGNAFFIAEMLRYLVDSRQLSYDGLTWALLLADGAVGVPQSIELLVTRRLADLSPDALHLAKVGAVLAEDLDPKTLGALVGLADQALLDALNELLERRVLERAAERYKFTHDRIRESLYQTLDPFERRNLHQRLAHQLAALKAPSAVLAHHFLGAENLAKGVSCLRQAGLDAERIGAIHEAYRHWRHAMEILEAHPELDPGQLLLDLWLDLGMKCGFSVDSKLGEVVLRKALAALEPIGKPHVASKLLGVNLKLIQLLTGPMATPIIRFLS